MGCVFDSALFACLNVTGLGLVVLGYLGFWLGCVVWCWLNDCVVGLVNSVVLNISLFGYWFVVF